MTLVEAKAFLDIISKATSLLLKRRDNKKKVSEEIQSFPEKVQLFEDKKVLWVQTLEKHPLQQDHPLIRGVLKAVEALEKAERDFTSLQDSNLCLREWNKTWSPERWTTIFKAVDDAFSKIVQYLEEKQRIEGLVEWESNKIKVPFCFSRDKKYVQIKGTVEKIRKVLDEAGSVKRVVLLYGGSGAGKSSLAKYLALDYYQESQGVSSSSSACRFSDGVVFIPCGKNADSLSLIQKLSIDLGYNLDASQGRGVQVNAHDRNNVFEDLKRTLISKLEPGKSILVILDNVWDQQLVADLLVELDGVKYLITSQEKNIYSDEVVEYVPIGTLSIGEACQVFANHILGWSDKAFPVHVQAEVEGLIADVEKHPLVLANLATLMKFEEVPDLRKWKQLRKELKNAIEIADRSISKPMLFGEPYGVNLIASLTMAIDLISKEARSLLFLVAICSGHGVDENVLRLWFKSLHDGPTTLIYDHAYEDLVDRSLISVSGIKVTWGDEPRNVCCVHDLRRALICERYEGPINEILQKLMGRERSMTGETGEVSSDRTEEEDLAAVLVFVFGDVKYRDEARRRIEIDECFEEGRTWKNSWRRVQLQICMNLLSRLLHHDLVEARKKKRYILCRTVLLHFMRRALRRRER